MFSHIHVYMNTTQDPWQPPCISWMVFEPLLRQRSFKHLSTVDGEHITNIVQPVLTCDISSMTVFVNSLGSLTFLLFWGGVHIPSSWIWTNLWLLWPVECGRSDTVWLPKLGQKKPHSFHLDPLEYSLWSKPATMSKVQYHKITMLESSHVGTPVNSPSWAPRQ